MPIKMDDQDHQMILDNINESVNDENQIVSCRWISVNFKLSLRMSIQMLEEFSKTHMDDIQINYFLGGRKVDDEGNVVSFYSIVNQKNLEETKQSCDTVTSCHIFSVQKIAVKNDVYSLYNSYKSALGNVSDDVNKFSTIKFNDVETRKTVDVKHHVSDQKSQLDSSKNDVVEHQTKSPPSKKPKAEPAERKDLKNTKKDAKKVNTIGSLMANSTKKVDTAKQSTSDKKEDSAKSSTLDKKVESGKSSISDKKVDSTKSSTLDKTDKKKSDPTRSQQKSSSSNKTVKTSKEENEPDLFSSVNKSSKKKEETSGKRKIESDSESEEDDFEKFLSKSKKPNIEDSQKKDTENKSKTTEKSKDATKKKKKETKKEKDRENKDKETNLSSKVKSNDTSKDLSSEKENENKEDSVIPPTPELKRTDTKTSKTKRRGTRMVMKTHQFVDESGFMVTQKKCETESFSEDSDSEVQNESTSDKKETIIDLDKKIEKSSKEETSKPTKKKQPTLMNFFKKK